MGQGILLSADQEVDFMVHGVFSYKWFGHTVWITTTHVCVLILFSFFSLTFCTAQSTICVINVMHRRCMM